jgi:ABC-type nitrate/sulfonate/bicarbonate transport system substrate-binding protein
VPVGFDTAIVLSAPDLAYPVYLNEEPYKLTGKIGRPIVVFDPAADGIELYGNVLIVRKDYAGANPQTVKALQNLLRESWIKAANNQSEAVTFVATLYKGVSQDVLEQQISKTIEFVSYGNRQPGSMDLSSNGEWARTLSALQEAGIVSQNLNFDTVKKYLIPPE